MNTSTLLLVVVGVLALTAVVFITLWSYRAAILPRRSSGGFPCAIRHLSPIPAQQWKAGRAEFAAGAVHWFAKGSMKPGPDLLLERTHLTIVGQRTSDDSMPVMAGNVVVVRCTMRDRSFDLALPVEAHTGLVSWLEATPPHGLPISS